MVCQLRGQVGLYKSLLTTGSTLLRWMRTLTLWYDDVIKWKHFPRHWPFVWGIHRSPVNSPHKGQLRGALMFSLIFDWIKHLSKQSWRWWFETLSGPLWRHCNGSRRWSLHFTAVCKDCTVSLLSRRSHWSSCICSSRAKKTTTQIMFMQL